MPLIFDVKVVPSSGRNLWKLDKSGTLKCFLKSPPERGLANKELIKLLSKAVSVPQSAVVIVSGGASRNKRIKISIEMTFDELLTLLKVERQKSLFE